ncbi:MAG TPA: hypothetical protein VK866_18000 [Acidimicrobiales bacterium]|nr:hypothetical protein [Acidimicrobiales bacterium]
MILDAGFLTSVDRSETTAHAFLAAANRSQTSLHTTHPVVAQVWRGPRQARLGAFLAAIEIHPFDDGRAVGRLLSQTRTADVVDAHLVICAVRLGHGILSGDADDLTALAAVLGPAAPEIHRWP